MKDKTNVRARFLTDVAAHEMTILRDDGLYRHLRFSVPRSSFYRFDLVTWPGYLAITGDMGSSTFARIPDMFTFFRAAPGQGDKPAEEMGINPSYWGEKLVAVDRNGWKEFDKDHFKRVLVEQVKEYGAKGMKNKILQEVKEEVFSLLDDANGALAMDAASKFDCEGFTFSDVFDHDYERPTFHYLWLCWAIVWGIRQYDQRAIVQPAIKEVPCEQSSRS